MENKNTKRVIYTLTEKGEQYLINNTKNMKLDYSEFDKKFPLIFIKNEYEGDKKFYYLLENITNEVKQFISSLLEQEKIKWLEALPKESPHQSVSEYYSGFNACLIEIKDKLKI
jgi:DNA-binding PadR family transcriptional regulator